MSSLDRLFGLGREIDREHSSMSPYSYLGFKYKLKHYRLISSGEVMVKGKDISLPKYVRDFIMSHGEVLMMANMINYSVAGIIFRSMSTKAFLDYGNTKGMLYGLGYLAKDFSAEQPLVVVEGPKDRDALAQYYPNVVATMTSTLSKSQIDIIQSLSNNVLLLFDFDKPGQDGAYKALRALKGKVNVHMLQQAPNCKDTGDLVTLEMNHSSELQYSIDYLLSQINLYKR